MPKKHREKPLYVRGEYKLFPARAGRNFDITWYDGKRERSLSTGTRDEARARIALDNEYVKRHGGVPSCPTCGRPMDQRSGLVATIIANYLETKPAGDAVHPRLAHVLDFLEATNKVEERCDAVDEPWATAFRKWAIVQPIVVKRRISPRGKPAVYEDVKRPRAPSTVENSLIQLAAAMRFGGVEPGFSPTSTKDLNRTPQHRSDTRELARMFDYCLNPKGARSDKEMERRRRERENLLKFLRASVATWARPDAVFDISTAPERGQWLSNARVLKLNPIGRRQTRKYRATVPIAHQFASHLDDCDGLYLPVADVDSAWATMAKAIALPEGREAGLKLIRRSVSHIVRGLIGEEHWIQGQIFLGHNKTSTSDVYALFDPKNLGMALKATELVIDEIESLCPGAFYRNFTATGGRVVSIAAGKKL